MKNGPCPCGKSSDGFYPYPDGGYCFVCNKKEKGNIMVEEKNNEIQPVVGTLEYLPWRGITAETFRKFKAPTIVDGEGTPTKLIIPFTSEARNLTPLDREKPGPKYLFEGKGSHKIGGSDIFPKGSARSITICEGGLDGFSTYQLLGPQHPVVYVRSTSSAKRECQESHEYLNSFERIYICFDNDGPGRKATEEISQLFDFNKVYNVKVDGANDVNEMLQNGLGDKFVKLWWNAKKFVPDGFLSSYDDIAEVLKQRPAKPISTYPWPTLQKATYGIFPSQLILVKAQTKIGKTEFISAIEDHVLQTTDLNIGVIHIEDTKDRVIKRYASYELGYPVHLPTSFATNDEILAAYKARTKRDNRVHIYSHFGSKDPSIIVDAIRYLYTVAECDIVFLDHVSMVVSGLADDDERKVLDALGTNLATMCNDLNKSLVAVTHVNDNGRSRGSRIFEQVAHTIVNLTRDKEAKDEKERNTTTLSLEGNRMGSVTGPMGKLIFNPETWTITEEVINWDRNLQNILKASA